MGTLWLLSWKQRLGRTSPGHTYTPRALKATLGLRDPDRRGTQGLRRGDLLHGLQHRVWPLIGLISRAALTRKYQVPGLS